MDDRVVIFLSLVSVVRFLLRVYLPPFVTFVFKLI